MAPTSWPALLGDIPNWIVALATIGALVFAYRAARNTLELLRIENRREERTIAEREGRQAALIDAWEARLTPAEYPTMTINEVPPLVVHLVNASDVSIFDVKIDWYSHNRNDFKAGCIRPILTPGKFHELVPTNMRPRDPDNPELEDGTVPISTWPFILKFRDRNGLLWRRAFDGRMSQIDQQEYAAR